MSLLQTARDTLKEIPMADILRERLSLALDRLAEAERQIEILQSQKGQLEFQLQAVTLDYEKAQLELHSIRELHKEEVRIFRSAEFRRGTRTRGQWLPFCPQCHLPANAPQGDFFLACSASCGWCADFDKTELPALLLDLEANPA
jgi:hypothetical protein